jgi:hypothetical protein
MHGVQEKGQAHERLPQNCSITTPIVSPINSYPVIRVFLDLWNSIR